MRALGWMVWIVACGGSSAATVVEVPPENLPAPPPPVTATVALPAPVPACTAPQDLGGCDEIARVRVGGVSLSSSTCRVDLRVATGDIGRVMRCPSGAVVVFDRVKYGGTYDGTTLDACVITQYRFMDGCVWQSLQRVHGRRDGLALDYTEKPQPGAGCAPAAACTARAELQVIGP